MQLSLFDKVKQVYGESTSPLDNETLYARVAAKAGISQDELNHQSPIGKSSTPRSKLKRAIRWHQQTMKAAGWLERTEERGVWQLTQNGKHQLTKISDSYSLIAFSTDLGVAIWGSCTNAFKNLNEEISLILTSPPYPLRQPRAYGNVEVNQYIDFICSSLEPVVKHLKLGGSITLNLSNDIFEHRSPARSLYLEKLTIALCERLGLFLMDRLIWNCPNKLPGPTHWVSTKRTHLNVGFEPILWLSNSPDNVFSDNRQVLQPHSEKHLKLIQDGGEKRTADYSDGAYKIRPGNFSSATPGKIPKNVITVANTCHSQRTYKAMARALNLPVHGAPMPLKLAKFLIEFLTPADEEQLVVDPFGGSLTTALAAEQLGRRWVATEIFWEYLRGAATRFKADLNPFFTEI